MLRSFWCLTKSKYMFIYKSMNYSHWKFVETLTPKAVQNIYLTCKRLIQKISSSLLFLTNQISLKSSQCLFFIIGLISIIIFAKFEEVIHLPCHEFLKYRIMRACGQYINVPRYSLTLEVLTQL